MSIGNPDEAQTPAETCLTASPAASSYLSTVEWGLKLSWRRWLALTIVALVVSGALAANGWLELTVLGLLIAFVAVVQVIDAHGALQDVKGRQVRFPTTN